MNFTGGKPPLEYPGVVFELYRSPIDDSVEVTATVMPTVSGFNTLYSTKHQVSWQILQSSGSEEKAMSVIRDICLQSLSGVFPDIYDWVKTGPPAGPIKVDLFSFSETDFPESAGAQIFPYLKPGVPNPTYWDYVLSNGVKKFKVPGPSKMQQLGSGVMYLEKGDGSWAVGNVSSLSVELSEFKSPTPKNSIGQILSGSYNPPMGYNPTTGEPMTQLLSWEHAVSAAFEQALMEEQMDYEIKSIGMKDKNSKWRITSALQKSIRRGRADDADTYAQALMNGGEQEYLLNRLPVIAYEDIGLANPELVCKVTLICRDQGVRNKLGQLRAILWCARALADSPKSRLLCDLTALNETQKLSPAMPLPTEQLTATLESLHDILLGDAHFEDLKIALISVGTDFSQSLSTASVRDKLAGALLSAGKVPPHLIYMFLTGSKKGVHGQHVFVPMVYPLFQQVSLLQGNIETEYLNNIPAEAYDMYTQEGKAAISYFRKSFKLEKYTVDQVRIAVFLTDSALLSPVATNPKLSYLKAEFELDELARTDSLGASGADELMGLIYSGEAREALLWARKRVLGLVEGKPHA